MTLQEIATHLDAMSGHIQLLLVAQGDAASPALQKALLNTIEAAKALREVKA